MNKQTQFSVRINLIVKADSLEEARTHASHHLNDWFGSTDQESVLPSGQFPNGALLLWNFQQPEHPEKPEQPEEPERWDGQS